MMVRKFGKLVFVNSNFYVKTKKKKFELSPQAKILKIEGFEQFDLFLHKDKIGFWSVYDSITGCRVTKIHREIKKAILEAKKSFSRITPTAFEVLILKELKNRKLSPRYRYLVNPSKIR